MRQCVYLRPRHAGGACIIAGRPHLPVWLSKAASVWAVLYLLTSVTCLFAVGAADWAEAVAMATPIVVAVALILPDKYYRELAQAVLPGPKFDRLLNHGFLAGERVEGGWWRGKRHATNVVRRAHAPACRQAPIILTTCMQLGGILQMTCCPTAGTTRPSLHW